MKLERKLVNEERTLKRSSRLAVHGLKITISQYVELSQRFSAARNHGPQKVNRVQLIAGMSDCGKASQPLKRG